MKHIVLVCVLALMHGFLFGQNCVSQSLDARSTETIESIERQLASANNSSERSVTYIQTVVHVLWNHPNDNIADSVIQANIELVNKDLRRQNSDTSLTPDYFVPVAADTEIELKLAQVDPNGLPTTGITHTYTDSTEFWYNHPNMKHDSTGGKTAWNTQSYYNIWVVDQIEDENNGTYLALGSLPGSEPGNERGLVIINHQLTSDFGWRSISHEFGHYVCLLHPEQLDTCFDADLISDTPIGRIEYAWSCSDTVITCDNGPHGNMFMNFMSYSTLNCNNIFTQGQKERMLNCIETQLPGLTDYQFLGVDDVRSRLFEVYPNPSNDQISFQLPEKGNVSVIDMSGRTVFISTAVKGKNTLDIHDWPSGIYLLTVQTEQSISSARFVRN